MGCVGGDDGVSRHVPLSNLIAGFDVNFDDSLTHYFADVGDNNRGGNHKANQTRVDGEKTIAGFNLGDFVLFIRFCLEAMILYGNNVDAVFKHVRSKHISLKRCFKLAASIMS